jgi:uncharacterized protein
MPHEASGAVLLSTGVSPKAGIERGGTLRLDYSPRASPDPESKRTMADQPLKEKIRSDLNTARRERDKLTTTVVSMMLADIRNREIELGHEATDADVTSLVTTSIKRRREAAEQMRAGGREELAAREEKEAEILQRYLPPQLTEEEVREIVRAAISGGASDLGGVMKTIMPRVKGLFEGRELNRIVREELTS